MGPRQYVLTVYLMALSALAHGSPRISTKQLYSMLDGLKSELVGKYVCAVAGGGDRELCLGLGLDESRAANAQDMMRQFALPSSGRALYDEQIIRGEDTVEQLAAGMSTLTEVPDLLLKAKAAIEDTFAEPIPQAAVANMQVPPTLAAGSSGFLQDVPVNFDACGMHLAPEMEILEKYTGTQRERKMTIVSLQRADSRLCPIFKTRLKNSSLAAQGFSYFASVTGAHLTYPASAWSYPLRYDLSVSPPRLQPSPAAASNLAYDVRSQEWYQWAVSLKKDIFVLIHASQAVSPSMWKTMVREMRAVLKTLVSYDDYLAFDVASAAQAKCRANLVKATGAERGRFDEMLADLQERPPPMGVCVLRVCVCLCVCVGVFSILHTHTHTHIHAHTGARVQLQMRIREACNMLLTRRLAAQSSGGPQYIIFVSDGVFELQAQDLTCRSSAQALGIPFPVTDMHLITITMGNEADAEAMKDAACSEAGMWWRIHDGAQPLNRFVDFVREFTSFVIETSFVNTTNASSPAPADATTLNASRALGKEDAASKITWLPTRAQGYNTPRPLLLAAVPVFMTQPGVPPKLMGVVATELSVESVIDSLRDAYTALSVHGSDAFILYHRGTAGELLAHNNGLACILLLAVI